MSSIPPTERENDLEVEEQSQSSQPSRTFWNLCVLIVKHKGPLCIGISMVLLGTVAALLEPRVFGYAIDEAIIPKNGIRLRELGVIFFFVVTTRVLTVSQQGYFFEMLGQRVTQDLRLMLFSHLERMPVAAFDQYPAGRLLTRVTNDISSLNEMFSAGFVSMLCNVLLVIGILSWLLVLNFKLGLIAASVFPVLSLISVYFSKKLKVAYRNSRSRLSALNAFLAENFSGMKTVHLFNRQKLHLQKFNRLNQGYADAQVGSIRIFALFQPTITLSAGISIALMIYFGGQATLQGKIQVGVLVAYFSYALSLFQPVREIADKWNIFLSGMASAERVFSLFEWATEMESQAVESEATPIPNLRGEIVFENVWFAYQDERWILKDLSFTIHAGERIGVVGHTGSGKTTLMSLLMRFYEPQKGRILLDGKDIRSYDKRSLRATIGIVQQDVFLFSGSFEENVTFWQKMCPKKMESILSSLNISHKNSSCTLNERGSNFSMGERQLIAFARAIAKEPKMWILDEATANMDSGTELMLQRALEKASDHCTSLLIAHRLATVQSADRILVLHKGSLVEMGGHSELLAQDGLYARLFRCQEGVSKPLSIPKEF